VHFHVPFPSSINPRHVRNPFKNQSKSEIIFNVFVCEDEKEIKTADFFVFGLKDVALDGDGRRKRLRNP
jgi:hypothetical protein